MKKKNEKFLLYWGKDPTLHKATWGKKGVITMKTMTCKQMGGPCDFAMQADTPEEMMKKGGDHVNEMAAKGDQAHIAAKKMMDESGPDTDAGKAWMSKFMADFAVA